MATCEFCGKVTSNVTTIKVAGTNMQACNDCKHLGKSTSNLNQKLAHSFRYKKKTEPTYEIKNNYTSLLKSAMSKKGINLHDLAKTLNIKESSLNQYLSGKIKPDIQTARRLERYFEISITNQLETLENSTYNEDEILDSTNSSSGLSLGDLLKDQLNKKKK